MVFKLSGITNFQVDWKFDSEGGKNRKKTIPINNNHLCMKMILNTTTHVNCSTLTFYKILDIKLKENMSTILMF